MSADVKAPPVSGPAGTALRDVVEAEARKDARRRVARWISLVLLAVGVAAAAYVLRPKPIAESAKWKTQSLSRGDVIHFVSATGRLESRRSVQVGAEISGRIASVDVDFGDTVKE